MVKNDLFPVRAYFCPFCRKVFKRRRHLCSKDPRNKSCGSCTNIEEFDGIWYCKDYQHCLDSLIWDFDKDNPNPEFDIYQHKIVNCNRYNAIDLFADRLKEFLRKKEEK